ncbi:MAG: RNA polymerase Rpb6 [Bacteroidetes bacterium]|nr:RNA polymerase Rpb6 [Bacteroidota bacterium]
MLNLQDDINIQSVDVLDLTRGTNNVYKSLSIIGQRANQLAVQIKQELSGKLAEFGPPGDGLEEIVENAEQIEIARYYEAQPKPSLLALDEFLKGEVFFTDPLEA